MPMDSSVLILERHAHCGRFSSELGKRQSSSRINTPRKVVWGTHVLDAKVENVAHTSRSLRSDGSCLRFQVRKF